MNRLHIGCGTNYLEGWTNIDIDKEVKADWHGDACHMPNGLEDSLVQWAITEEERIKLDIDWTNRFDHIYSHHSLEHFTDLFQIVHELVRVSKNNATWEHTVPIWSWGQNQGNPYHHIYFSPETFRFFDKVNGIYKRGQKQDYSLEEISTVFNEQEITFKLRVHK